MRLLIIGRYAGLVRASAAATAAAAPAAHIAIAAILSGTGFTDLEGAPLKILAIETIEGGIGLRLIRHLDKSKAARFAAEFILYYHCAGNLAKAFESLAHIIL